MDFLSKIKPAYDSIAQSATDGTLKDALKLVSPEDVANLFVEDNVAEDSDVDSDALKEIILELAKGRYSELDEPKDEVTAVDANGDGDVDAILTETPDETSLEVDADNKEEADAADEAVDKVLDGWDALADTMAKENPISIDKVDAMADEAAEDNPISLDKVDAMADEAALDSTGRISSKEREKLTPEQKKLEDIARRQQNITSALADTVRFS